MTVTRCLGFAAVALSLAAPAAGQSVRLEFQDGRVTLSAQNASLRTILSEWSRLGGTTIVNAERLGGPVLTLELRDVPERQALDILLRSVAGYMLGPRQNGSAARSTVASILLVPTSSAPRSAPAASPPVFVPQAPPRPAAPEPLDPDIGDPPSGLEPEEPVGDRPVGPQRFPRIQLPPGANPPVPPRADPPDPQDDPDQSAPQAQPARPTNPFGVLPGSSRPGTIAPVPQPPRRNQPDIGEEP